MEDVEIDTREVTAVLPVGAYLALEVEERDLVGGDRGDDGDLRAQEVR